MARKPTTYEPSEVHPAEHHRADRKLIRVLKDLAQDNDDRGQAAYGEIAQIAHFHATDLALRLGFENANAFRQHAIFEDTRMRFTMSRSALTALGGDLGLSFDEIVKALEYAWPIRQEQRQRDLGDIILGAMRRESDPVLSVGLVIDRVRGDRFAHSYEIERGIRALADEGRITYEVDDRYFGGARVFLRNPE